MVGFRFRLMVKARGLELIRSDIRRSVSGIGTSAWRFGFRVWGLGFRV